MKLKKKALIIAVIVLVVIGVVLVFIDIVALRITTIAPADARRTNMLSVQAETVHRMTLVEKIDLNGDVMANQQATLYPKVSGTIDRMFYNMGDAVNRGTLLALIDTVELYQSVLQTKATYLNAKLNYDRTKDLIAQHLIAQQDVDNADVAMKTAEANYVTAATRLGFAHMTAPFKGIVTKRFLDAGGVVTQNATPLFTLMDLDQVKIIVNVLEKDVPRVPSIKRAIVTVNALPGKQFEGVVRRTSQALDMATRTMDVEVDIPNPSHQLKPGMFSSVSLIVGERPDRVVVPTQAVLKDNSGSYVFLVVNGRAKRTPVVIGVEQDNHYEVLKGLSGGENVIIMGQNQVRNDAEVKVQG